MTIIVRRIEGLFQNNCFAEATGFANQADPVAFCAVINFFAQASTFHDYLASKQNVITEDDNYRLSGNELKALYPRLNGTVTANAWVYHTQPLKTIEFKYNSSGLRVQKKVTANGKTEVTNCPFVNDVRPKKRKNRTLEYLTQGGACPELRQIFWSRESSRWRAFGDFQPRTDMGMSLLRRRYLFI